MRFTSLRFTDRAVKVLSVARQRAATQRHRYVAPEHVLFALAAVEVGPGRLTLQRLGVNLQNDVDRLEAMATAPPIAVAQQPSLSLETEHLVAEARDQSKKLGHRYVGTEHLVLGLLRCGQCPAGDYLRERGVTVEKFREETLKVLAGEE
jgi:ATP-dependent Clp protease ATP-binding subunit ClpC